MTQWIEKRNNCMNIICNVNPWTWIPAAWANFNLESWIFLSSWFSSPESRGSKQDSKNLGTLIIGWMMDTIVYPPEERWGENKKKNKNGAPGWKSEVKVGSPAQDSRLKRVKSQKVESGQRLWISEFEEQVVKKCLSSLVTSLVWFHNGEERQGEVTELTTVPILVSFHHR